MVQTDSLRLLLRLCWALFAFCPLVQAQNSVKNIEQSETKVATSPYDVNCEDTSTCQKLLSNYSNDHLIQAQWQQTLQEARGQSVYFYAWGADPQINSYIGWVADKVDSKYDITLEHVKLAQTSDAVSRVLAEKSAGNTNDGQVDLLWINGLNFATMAQSGLLESDWVQQLPNFVLTNPQQNPAMTMDFGVATKGMEAPWGKAALTFYYDSEHILTPPKTLSELLTWSKRNPGRFTYAKPPDFLGLSFLKYALIVVNQHQSAEVFNRLYEPPTAKSQTQLLSPLWQFLDDLHPHLWRKGSYFVSDGASIRRLVGDNELQIGFTFSASNIPGAVDRFELPLSIRSYAMKDGSLSNVHFVTIAFNAQHKAGAKVVSNFLMSIEAQAKKQQPSEWGDQLVIDLALLSPSEQALFRPPTLHKSALKSTNSSPSLSEPHPQWTMLLTSEWEKRYGAKQ